VWVNEAAGGETPAVAGLQQQQQLPPLPPSLAPSLPESLTPPPCMTNAGKYMSSCTYYLANGVHAAVLSCRLTLLTSCLSQTVRRVRT
jgi:hypothetical protein